MSIIYVLSIILMMILHILLHKKEEKQNIFKWLVISISILLCYNIFICVVMSFFKMHSTLINLSIINIIIDFIIGFKIYKDKKIQKYYINKIDIFFIIIISGIIFFTVIKQYGIPIKIKNGITDATVHYFVADEFYNYSTLLFDKNSDILNLWELYFFMPGAYINTGILFKIFSGIISETYFCKLYYIFEISMWFISGILMYILLSKNKQEEKTKILPVIFSIVYMLGYPLNSLISGFSYLSVALNIIITILIIMKEDINKYYKTILLFFLNFGLMFSYYFFGPVVYLAIFIQIIKDIKKNKEKIINIIYALIIPGIFGILFFVVFQLIKFNSNPINRYTEVLAKSGDIYTNFITNILIFLLLSIYYIIYSIKNKKSNIESKMLILNIIFSIILFIGMKLGKISEYYNYKVYYMLWIFVIAVGYNTIELIKKQKLKKISHILIGIYCVGLMTSIITAKKLLIFDIYAENSKHIQMDNSMISNKELEILEYYNDKINENNLNNETYMCVALQGNPRAIWIYAITKNPYDYINLAFEEPTTTIEQFIKSEKKYFVLFKQDYFGEFEKIDTEIEQNNLKVLFRNEEGIILEKN